VTGDTALITMIDRFLGGTLDVVEFERDFLTSYKRSPIENPDLQRALGRAFLAVEAYDPMVTGDTETIHNTSYKGMVKELRAVREEIRRVQATLKSGVGPSP